MPSPTRRPTHHPLQPLLRAATFCTFAFLLAAPGHLHAGEGLGPFSNRLVIAEHLLLVKVVETNRTKGFNPGSTTFQVVEFFRDKHNKFRADQKFTKVSGGREKPGSLMLLWKFPPQYEMNHGSTEIWQVTTDDVRRFLREIPPEKPAKPADPTRLDYFVKHLEHLDPSLPKLPSKNSPPLRPPSRSASPVSFIRTDSARGSTAKSRSRTKLAAASTP